MTTHIGEQYLRQLGWYDPSDRDDSVTFIGVGGIGSFAAFGAAKLGIPNITLIDPDTVEIHNQPNQFYASAQVGAPKVIAMQERIGVEGGVTEVGIHQGAVANADAEGMDGEYPAALTGVVVSGLDSMAARAVVWEKVKLNPRVPLYIDGRLGGQIIVVYAVDPTNMDDVDAYEKTLHSDDEGVETPCTERGVIDVGLQVGSLITRALRRHFTGLPVEPIITVNQETAMTTHLSWPE